MASIANPATNGHAPTPRKTRRKARPAPVAPATRTITVVGTCATSHEVAHQLLDVREWRINDEEPFSRADVVILEDGRPVYILRTDGHGEQEVVELSPEEAKRYAPADDALPWRSFKLRTTRAG